MTCGQIYENAKEFYDKLGEKYLEDNLKNDGDVCYHPFTMKTYHTRGLIRRISDNEYQFFGGFVKDIDDEDIFKYVGVSVPYQSDETHNLEESISQCGFEFSCLPHFQKLAYLSAQIGGGR